MARRLALLLLATVACGGWACSRPSETTARRPNVVLVVVDTLRADRLSVYGHDRATSPRIEERLAARGTVVETAYVQAPWTLPSMASILTGSPPADLLDVDGAPSGIPEAATTLAESLSAAGYATAAFVANPTLHAGNGFAQGFDVFETAPYELESMTLHADRVHAAATTWLATRADAPDEPFFLYVHYLDPHDPYDNETIVDGRSPFEEEPYRGPLDGGSVHGLYLEALELDDETADVAHLRALYDAEVLYVDRFVGDLIERLERVVGCGGPGGGLDDTLVIFTSDHGEELYERRGWKHGETLDDEMIRVPLIARFDGVVPAGGRLEGPVRLLDLAPTVLDAVGIEAVGIETGRSIWPALRGEGVVPSTPIWSRHFSAGPERIARIANGRKDVLFDREAPFAPADEREAVLWRRDVERMDRFESYAVDPRTGAGERLDLEPKELREASTALVGHLDAWLEGLRVVAVGLAPGERLRATIDFEAPPVSVRPLFLGPDDRIEVDGTMLVVDWRGDALTKGVLVQGAVGGLRDLAAVVSRDIAFEDARDGGAVERPIRVVLGSEERTSWPAEGPLVGLRELLVDSTPLADVPQSEEPEAMLGLWILAPRAPYGAMTRDDETAARLRALGYVQ